MHSNPIFQRLTRDSSWPRSRGANIIMVLVFLAMGALLGGSEGVILRFLFQFPALRNPTIASPLSLLTPTRLLAFFIPVTVAMSMIVLLNRDKSTDDFRMLRLTNLSESDILWGYAAVGLYRLRLLLALTVGAQLALFVVAIPNALRQGSSESFGAFGGMVALIFVLQALLRLLNVGVLLWLALQAGLFLGLRTKSTVLGLGSIALLFVLLEVLQFAGILLVRSQLLVFSRNTGGAGLMPYFSALLGVSFVVTVLAAALAIAAQVLARRGLQSEAA